MRHWLVLVLFLFALGTLRVVACGEDRSCVEDEDCDDGNPCTRNSCVRYDPDAPFCEVVHSYCVHSQEIDGTPCGSGNVCVDGVCGENRCKDVVCDDGNVCTDETCDYWDGMCKFAPVFCDDGPCMEGTCEPALGCIFTPAEDGTGCAEGVIGVCLDDRCQEACERTSEEEYQCPILGLEFKICCPGDYRCRDNCEFDTCDSDSEEEYQCPILGFEHLFCCPYFDQCMPDCDFVYG